MANEGVEPPKDDVGKTPEEVQALVDAVGRHARALVLLACEAARRGVRVTTETVGDIFADLESKHPGERENSLYASLELSLRRVTGDERQKMHILGAFHGGYTFGVLVMVLDGDQDAAQALTDALIEVGLAELMEYNYLRLDPALPTYLWAQMDETERADARERWGQATRSLIEFLYRQQFQDAHLARRLTLLELPNLLAVLTWLEETQTPEDIIGLSGKVEHLLANLDKPRILTVAVAVRSRAAKRLGEWSHARFETEHLKVIQLVNSGTIRDAHESVQKLIINAQAVGETGYPGADYDLALAYLNLGWVLETGGAVEAALEPLAEAQRRFQALADGGNTSAAGMASVAITESGNCFRTLGRFNEAASAYEEAIKRKGELKDARGVAVNKGQLGTVWLYQRRYADALAAHEEARGIFEVLNEPAMVANAWHGIGRVLREARNYEAAERAYRQGLTLRVQHNLRRDEAASLIELGNLYNNMGRLEEAVAFQRQAADVNSEMGDLRYEGVARSNIAISLIKLKRYDEARGELLRALECKEPFGHAAEPWKTWDILRDLEEATGHPEAAAETQAKAKEAYLAYRRDGGVAQRRYEEMFRGEVGDR